MEDMKMNARKTPNVCPAHFSERPGSITRNGSGKTARNVATARTARFGQSLPAVFPCSNLPVLARTGVRQGTGSTRNNEPIGDHPVPVRSLPIIFPRSCCSLMAGKDCLKRSTLTFRAVAVCGLAVPRSFPPLTQSPQLPKFSPYWLIAAFLPRAMPR